MQLKMIALACIVWVAMGTVDQAFGQDGPKAPGAANKDVVATPQVHGTLDNLQTAYFAESSSSALYAGYAKKADDEKYYQLASMFRAISRGEAIHAENCAGLIRQMGGTIPAVNEPAIIATTVQNLHEADATQVYETDEMYPQFVEQARKENNKAAEKVFNYNMAAEPAHHALFQQAIKDPEGYQGGSAIPFFVCPTCGYAVRIMKASACPACSTPKERFETVR